MSSGSLLEVHWKFV